MRSLNVIVAGLVLASSVARHQLAAQEPVQRNQVTLDASFLAAGLSVARSTSAGTLVGVGAGLGSEFNVRLVLGESGGKKSTEVVHIALFTRLETPGRWQYDVGVKLAADIHTARVASESEVGGFLGGYVAPMWGGRHFRIGPRAQAGAYWLSPSPTFAVFITPLTGRFVF